MKISLKHLSQYCPPLPEDPSEVRHLLDDVGIEVKRLEEDGGDVFLSIELLANRGDHRCYAGVAREVVGRLGGELRFPTAAQLKVADAGVPIRVQTELCLLYTVTVLEVGASNYCLPPNVVRPMIVAGFQPVSALVDVTNLVNLEMGQPTHFFDASTIAGAITVRTSREREKAWPLFQPGPVDLPTGTLVVADDEKILAIAGVIGCEESKVTERTQRAILESAAFDPIAVRKASRGLHIQTDASARFERGCDPALTLGGAGRVVYLLETHARCRRAGPTTVAGSWRDPKRTIDVDLECLQNFLGRQLSAHEYKQRLERYGFSVTVDADTRRVAVIIPPHRLWDVCSPEDVAEEIARSIGYNELPESLPPPSMGVQPSKLEVVRGKVEDVLVGMGFYEVMTDGFYSRKVREKLCPGESHPLWNHVETQNALDASFSLLKNNCLAQAVEAIDLNLRLGTETLKLFEWTRTFHPDPSASNGVCHERKMLWLTACGHARGGTWAEKPHPVDIWFLKGIVEEIAAELRIALTVGPAETGYALAQCFHPHRQATIRLGERVVGLLGEVDWRVLRSYGIKRTRPYYLEVDADALCFEENVGEYALPPRRPPSVRMLAFTLPHKLQAGEVVRSLSQNGPEWLQRVSIVDLYQHEEQGHQVRTITYSLSYRNDQSEHSADEINEVTQRLIQAVERDLGNRGVRLRVQETEQA